MNIFSHFEPYCRAILPMDYYIVQLFRNFFLSSPVNFCNPGEYVYKPRENPDSIATRVEKIQLTSLLSMLYTTLFYATIYYALLHYVVSQIWGLKFKIQKSGPIKKSVYLSHFHISSMR